MKLASPTRLGKGDTVNPIDYLLVPPGPKPYRVEGKKNGSIYNSLANYTSVSPGLDTTIKIGNFLTFNRIIVTNVSSTFKSKMDRNGKPLHAEVNFSFRSYNTPLREDIDLIFNGGESG